MAFDSKNVEVVKNVNLLKISRHPVSLSRTHLKIGGTRPSADGPGSFRMDNALHCEALKKSQAVAVMDCGMDSTIVVGSCIQALILLSSRRRALLQETCREVESCICI